MFPTKKEGSGVHFSSYDPHLFKMNTLFQGRKLSVMIGFRQNICYDGVSQLIWGEDHYIFINNSLLNPATIGSVYSLLDLCQFSTYQRYYGYLVISNYQSSKEVEK